MKRKPIRPLLDTNFLSDLEEKVWTNFFKNLCTIMNGKPPPKKITPRRKRISPLPNIYITCQSENYRQVKTGQKTLFVPKYFKRVPIQSCENKFYTNSITDKKDECYQCTKWMEFIPADWVTFYRSYYEKKKRKKIFIHETRKSTEHKRRKKRRPIIQR